MISLETKIKIQKILNAIETGVPQGDYANISLYHDGPQKIKQITYGKSQTTEWGNLSKLINLYVEKKGEFADDLRPYQSEIGVVSFADDEDLISTLKKAGHDPIMIEAQDEFFDEVYWKPALKWFEEKKFTLPLSMLVIYDSFIQSGSMLKFLRNKFPETTPVNGGEEKIWIEKYLKARHDWLSNHQEKILRNSSYRTRDLLKVLSDNDWKLCGEIRANDCKIA